MQGFAIKILALQAGYSGLLQHLAINHTAEVWNCFRSWLHTMNPAMPSSELIVASALRSTLPVFLAVPTFASDLTRHLTVNG